MAEPEETRQDEAQRLEETAPTTEEMRQLEVEIYDQNQLDRRRKVLDLRARRFSVGRIASALSCSPNTVASDLKWIREQGAKVFGSHPEFDPYAFVWQSLCLFEDIESTALRASMTEGIKIHEKMLCLAEARAARKTMIDMLLDTGQLQRAPVNVTVNLPNAEQIRLAVDAAVTDRDVIDVQPSRRLRVTDGSAPQTPNELSDHD